MKSEKLDMHKADSGSSDDVLTISKAIKKRKRNKKTKAPTKEEGTVKRKRVTFSIEKNMTRGKLFDNLTL